MTATERRYDIDWLRVIAIGLLIMYHIGFVFLPWGVFIGFIQNDQSLDFIWNPMSMLNVWRIPLLFFVSGLGVSFAIRKRNWKQLIAERTMRILIPFIFGILVIVPLHQFLWQSYYKQDFAYSIQPGHLWFLGNIFIYVILLSPLFFYLKKNENSKFSKWLKKLYKSPAGLLGMTGVFVLEALLVRPETYETYSMTMHGFLLGFLAFLFGFLCVYTGSAFWETVQRWRWLLLTLAVTFFVFRIIKFQLQAPNYLKAIESNMWIFSIFGFGYKYLNRPGKTLSYLSQAAYPVYILHMIFLYGGAYLILPLEIPGGLKLIIITTFTFIGCFISYEFIIRRIQILRPLFGLKPIKAGLK